MNGASEKTGPVVLLIIDGWGIAPESGGNAITQANPVNLRELVSKYPATILSLVEAGAMEKNIDLTRNYLTLGTGKNKLSAADQSLFDLLRAAGLKWKILVEPEKMAYGLYFMNNRRKIEAENYQIVDSAPTDDSPAIVSELIAAELLNEIKGRKQDFIVAIMANLDLAAHRGNFAATVAAAGLLDRLLKNIAQTVLDNSGVLLITAAHGHAEEALDMKTELANKKDTRNPVPLIIAGQQFEGKSFGFMEAPGSDLALVPPAGSLADVMPTILKILGLPIPPDLDGRPLI
ncbi:MAG TPA: hypothetical protein VMC41_01320 [Candidatus Nanoarchaeia archaeon]|nr:hypothetical protein [Candidatus Nanoarchaeia archaeon]